MNLVMLKFCYMQPESLSSHSVLYVCISSIRGVSYISTTSKLRNILISVCYKHIIETIYSYHISCQLDNIFSEQNTMKCIYFQSFSKTLFPIILIRYKEICIGECIEKE